MNATRPERHPLELIHPRSLKHLSHHLELLVRGRLWLQVLIAMALGLAAGVLIGPSAGLVARDTGIVIGNWLALPGQVFLALIQMIVVPLVVASIIRGLAATENLEQLRRIGLRTVLFFVASTALAIVVGLALAYAVAPGQYVAAEGLTAQASAVPAPAATAAAPSLGELPQKLVGLLPTNPLGSMLSADMLQIVIFAFFVGAALVMMAPRQAQPLLDLTGSLQEVCMTVVRWAMLLAPLAVFGLLAQLGSKIGLDALIGMAAYVATVIAGLLIVLAAYLGVIAAVARQSPWAFLGEVRELMLLAFSTSSSAAVMPVTIRTAEEKLGLRPSIAQFVIPLGATINMNGTALYQGVAAVFLAQVFGVEISAGGLVLLVLTAVGASIGAPGTPGVGIVILAMLLATIGVPPAGVALIMGVDRILDMSRTAINVCGDLVAATVMDRWVGGARPVADLRAAEEARERARGSTGEDVIVETP